MDKIYKTLLFDGKISLAILETTEIVNQAIKYHKLTPLTAAALGRTMTASLFMASNLKNEGDKLSVTISGDGKGGQIIVSVDSKLRVRGYIDNPTANLPLNELGKLDVRGCVGKGRMTIVRNMGLKEPYSGSCEIVSGEIAEDFAYYYTISEQEPTAMALGVLVDGEGKCIGAGGIVMQALPGCDDETAIEAQKIIMKYGDISTHIKNRGANGIKNEDFKGLYFTERDAKYECICSQDYIDSMIISLGKEEIYDILNEQGEILVECQYCDKKYRYLEKDVKVLLGENDG
ncbi:MAG: Hsp33 family molecular chaperone HslO [Clostridia bacterium]|nr:Hsp33 family molecular chaperone HslO [Clostridia bacterium]